MIYKRKMGQPDPEISTRHIKGDLKIHQDSYGVYKVLISLSQYFGGISQYFCTLVHYFCTLVQYL